MSESGAVLRERRGPVVELVLNRPERRNALNGELVRQLTEAIEEVGSESRTTVIALRGAGSDFCSGADLAEIHDAIEAGILENLAETDRLAALFIAMRRSPAVIVAAVQGRALAGGCGLATACDLVLASDDAHFGYPEVQLGFVPAMVMAILRRNCGEKQAFEMLTTGRVYTAAEARRIGIVNEVFAAEQFETESARFIEELGGRSASALRLIKRLFYHQDSLSFEAGIRAGSDVNVLARLTTDAQSGIARFLDRKARREKES